MARTLAAGLVLGLAVVAVVVLSAPAAKAHTELVGASPGPGASVGSLAVLRLAFGEPVVAELTEVTLSADGVVVDLPRPVVTGPAVEVPVRDVPPPGSYLVAYRTVASDGHVIAGSFSFDLEPASPSGTSRSGARTDPDSGATTPKGSPTSPRWLRQHATSGDGPSSAGVRIGQVMTGLGIGTIVGASLVRRHRSRRPR